MDNNINNNKNKKNSIVIETPVFFNQLGKICFFCISLIKGARKKKKKNIYVKSLL